MPVLVRPFTSRCRMLMAWCAAAGMAGGAHAGEGSATHYRCTLLDGSVRVVAHDLAASFSGAVRECTGFEVKTLALRDAPAPAPAAPASWITTIDGRDRGEGAGLVTMPSALIDLVRAACTRHGLDPSLVAALIYVESRFHVRAQSPKGAVGLMQVTPATAARYGVAAASQLFDPRINVDVGTRYLRDLQEMFPGRVDLALAAYNAGEGAVSRHGNRVPPFKETQDYVRQILALARNGDWPDL